MSQGDMRRERQTRALYQDSVNSMEVLGKACAVLVPVLDAKVNAQDHDSC